MARASTTGNSGANNTSLRAAARIKNDEFYTQLTDIEKELLNYEAHFKGKIVFCNCDDPEWSNFWKLFTKKFEHLGLAKVVATHYNPKGAPSYKLEYFGKDRPLVKTSLSGDGDFRSEECVKLLEEADIVVTNPPFSLFREYVAQLVALGKQFLIIGNNNALSYKEIFKLVKGNQLWLGVSPRSMTFKLPDGSTKNVNACWFTNLSHKRRNQELILFQRYRGNEQAYSRYDNYNAIDVSKVVDIPVDYEGFMGVPITFMDKYNPGQFEILGIMNTGEENPGIRLPETEHGRPVIRGRELYLRILIRHKQTSCVATN